VSTVQTLEGVFWSWHA